MPVPTRVRATCLHDGAWRLDSIGADPVTKAEFDTLTPFRAWEALDQRQTELGLGLHGDNLTALPTGIFDADGWNRNYTINDTFRPQEIGTFKEVHCEIKKCDVNALAAVGGELYISKPSA